MSDSEKKKSLSVFLCSICKLLVSIVSLFKGSLLMVHSHLDGGGGTVTITFFDFSSASNTIKPQLLDEKLQLMGAGVSTESWIIDYLTGRPQFVHLDHDLTDVVVS